MATKLDYAVGDKEHGALVQVSQALGFIPIKDPDVVWDAHEVLAVSSTALALTANLAGNADIVKISIETSQMRYFLHGPVPTTSTGHMLNVGDLVFLTGRAEIDNFRIIQYLTAGSALCTYGRRVMP